MGYAGREPGWRDDPYAGGSEPGWDPYGNYGTQQPGSYAPPGTYGPPGTLPYDYGYGPPGVPYGRVDNSSAIAALVCNIIATVICCNFLCVPGIITASIAMGKAQTEPAGARKLVISSWIILGVGMVLEIAAIAIAIAAGASTNDPGYGGTGGV